jgi:hypothetical protein
MSWCLVGSEMCIRDRGMAMPDNVFVAAVSSHCDNESSYGSCMLHLTKAVSFNG